MTTADDHPSSSHPRATSGPDTDRVVRLLWRNRVGEPQGSRGPKPRVSVDQVVEAAIALADTEGIEAFTLRKVADRLGLRVMSLYTYVPGRQELLVLMLDHVVGERPPPPLPERVRDRLALVAEELWREYHRHPWLLQVDRSRPWTGPHAAARYEWQLRAVEGASLDDVGMDQVVTLLAGVAEHAARAEIDARHARRSTGTSDREWWEDQEPALRAVMDPAEFPLAARVGRTAGMTYDAARDPGLSFRFGLGVVLDGLLSVT